MGATGNNATPPAPAEAPGVERLDPVEIARGLSIDPRIPALVPGFDAPFFQAGLAGYSDGAMRLVARRHGCPYAVTEALLDRTLLAGGRGFAKADLGDLHDNLPGGADDHPLAGQIMGSDPGEMAAAALKMAEQGAQGDGAYRVLAYGQAKMPAVWPSTRRRFDPTEGAGVDEFEEWACDVDEEAECEHDEHSEAVEASHRRDPPAADATDPGMRDARSTGSAAGDAARFEVIDVNLACPVKKIRARARGGHWLREPEGAIAILRAVRSAVPRTIPVTVKMRRSYDDTPEQARNFERIFNAAYEIGCAWVTVHARTVEQKYVGPSRWPALRDLTRRYPDRIIFGSGDIWNAGDIFRMIAYTGVHAVSVARGCIGNPWIFRQARAMMRGEPALSPTIAQQRRVMLEHLDLAIRLDGERLAGRTMRKFGVRFAAHHPRADEVKARLVRCEDAATWRSAIEEMYAPVDEVAPSLGPR